MSPYRIGDRVVTIAGQPTRLRLTLSALAEIAQLTECDGPADLAARLRDKKNGSGIWSLVLSALATPRPMRVLSERQIAALLPDIVAVITEGLMS